MIDTIYIERAAAAHHRTRAILARFADARVVECAHYGEVFNRHNQDFRLQKSKPALILAHKNQRRLLPIPPGYGIGGERGFYFSHMLNCLYDCRYCFLQGMFWSANYVLFVNYEDFIADIVGSCLNTDGDNYFFSGYDCDSLALEPLTSFAQTFVPALTAVPNAWLELRTKSTQIRSLLDLPAAPRTICAFSLNPEPIARALEHRAPPLLQRIDAMARLQDRGWTIGLRFDPLILVDDFRAVYGACFDAIFARIDGAKLHSVTLGVFRLPSAFAKRMHRLYPDEPFLAGPMVEDCGRLSYTPTTSRALLQWCQAELVRRVGHARVHVQRG